MPCSIPEPMYLSRPPATAAAVQVIENTTAISRTVTPFGPTTSQTPPPVFTRSTTAAAAAVAGGGTYDADSSPGDEGLGGLVVALPIGSSELGEGDIKERRANIRSSGGSSRWVVQTQHWY